MPNHQVLVHLLLRLESTGFGGGFGKEGGQAGVIVEGGQAGVIVGIRKVQAGQIVREGPVELTGIEDGVIVCHVSEI